MSKNAVLLLAIGLLAGFAISCVVQQPNGTGDAHAQQGGGDKAAPSGIEKGAKISYGNGTNGFGNLADPPVILEVRGKWILLKGVGVEDIDKTATRWVNLDQLAWYKVSK